MDNQYKELEVRSIFLLGLQVWFFSRAVCAEFGNIQENERDACISQAKEEHAAYGDVLLGDFNDSFQNLSLKANMMLNYAERNPSIYDVIYYGDSDVLLNPLVLIETIVRLCDKVKFVSLLFKLVQG